MKKKDITRTIFSNITHTMNNLIYDRASLRSVPYFSYRRGLVDWMCQKCEEMNMSVITSHKSVAIFDLFLSHPS